MADSGELRNILNQITEDEWLRIRAVQDAISPPTHGAHRVMTHDPTQNRWPEIEEARKEEPMNQDEWMFADQPPLTPQQVEDWQQPVAGHEHHHCETCPLPGETD